MKVITNKLRQIFSTCEGEAHALLSVTDIDVETMRFMSDLVHDLLEVLEKSNDDDKVEEELQEALPFLSRIKTLKEANLLAEGDDIWARVYVEYDSRKKIDKLPSRIDGFRRSLKGIFGRIYEAFDTPRVEFQHESGNGILGIDTSVIKWDKVREVTALEQWPYEVMTHTQDEEDFEDDRTATRGYKIRK